MVWIRGFIRVVERRPLGSRRSQDELEREPSPSLPGIFCQLYYEQRSAAAGTARSVRAILSPIGHKHSTERSSERQRSRTSSFLTFTHSETQWKRSALEEA